MPKPVWPPARSWIAHYDRSWFTDDLTAGLTVGVMLIPQGMAYALLAGLPPVYGLYAATLPLLVYALLGTSRQLAVGPVAMDSLLTATGVGALAAVGTEQYLYLAVLLALLVGGIQLLAGVLRLGFLVDLLSRPIISGFTSAAALIIGLSQLPHLMGVDLGRSPYVQEILYSAIVHVPEINPVTLVLGLGGIFVLVGLKRWLPAVPGPLVVVGLAIAAVYFGGLFATGVSIVGEVPAGLPALGLPAMALTDVRALLPTALTIALIGFMEGIAVAKAVNARHPEYVVVPNQELVAIGASNIGSALVGGFPVAGGLSRTAVNDAAGATTGLAAVISAGVIIMTLLFLTPLFYYLPQAVLASIIMVAVFKLIDWREAVRLWRVDRSDFWMLAVTFLATLSLGIQTGIAAGVALSIGVHVYRSMRPHLAVLGRIEGTHTYRNVNRFPEALEEPGTLILRFDAPLYFGNMSYFEAQLESLLAERQRALHTIVLNAEAIAGIDSSAMYGLRRFVTDQRGRGVTVRLAGVIGPVRDAMKQAGLYEDVGRENFFLDVDQAVHNHCRTGYALQSNVP
ncbi:SulP family sulfate permease [Neolewinella xylanilytica]|uniref:SulP family sulfate permease n=1 Tax=Neolewinella xylanilytica TaxID=1514080 RepID=A0A2S6IA16_9BACT|nr:solute carrier family 26 protein [Neolewinella xylanilytica]PPK88343.1 SulP family sulfate permease [Neolewinella xylanilytica]